MARTPVVTPLGALQTWSPKPATTRLAQHVQAIVTLSLRSERPRVTDWLEIDRMTPDTLKTQQTDQEETEMTPIAIWLAKSASNAIADNGSNNRIDTSNPGSWCDRANVDGNGNDVTLQGPSDTVEIRGDKNGATVWGSQNEVHETGNHNSASQDGHGNASKITADGSRSEQSGDRNQATIDGGGSVVDMIRQYGNDNHSQIQGDHDSLSTSGNHNTASLRNAHNVHGQIQGDHDQVDVDGAADMKFKVRAATTFTPATTMAAGRGATPHGARTGSGS